jgi:hypothetical protein
MQDLDKVLNFLGTIKIFYELTDSHIEAFLPGVSIDRGKIIINVSELKMLGDILHEAGHYAIIPLPYRNYIVNSDLDELYDSFESEFPDLLLPDGSENPIGRALIQVDEQAVIAWSYAAAVACGLDVATMHFEDTFTAPWTEIVHGLRKNCDAGVASLHYAKMTTKTTFPRMIRWLQI